MIGLRANRKHTALTQCVATATDIPNFRRCKSQVLVAHDLGDRRCHFGKDAPLKLLKIALRSPIAENVFPKLAHRHAAQWRKRLLIETFVDKLSDIVLQERLSQNFLKGQISQRTLCRDSLLLGGSSDSGKLITRLKFIRFRKYFS